MANAYDSNLDEIVVTRKQTPKLCSEDVFVKLNENGALYSELGCVELNVNLPIFQRMLAELPLLWGCHKTKEIYGYERKVIWEFDQWCGDEQEYEDEIGHNRNVNALDIIWYLRWGWKLKWTDIMALVLGCQDKGWDALRSNFPVTSERGDYIYVPILDLNHHEEIVQHIKNACGDGCNGSVREFGWAYDAVRRQMEEEREQMALKQAEKELVIEGYERPDLTFPDSVFEHCPIFKEYADTLQKTISLNPSMFYLPAFIEFSSLLGVIHWINSGGLNTCGACWGFSIGESNTGKSQGNTFASAPHYAIAQEIARGISGLENTLPKDEEELSNTNLKVKKGVDVSEISPSFLITDPTIESIGQLFFMNDRGLLFVAEELGWIIVPILGKGNRNGSIDKLCGMWDCKPQVVTAKTAIQANGKHDIWLPASTFAWWGGTQPSNMRDWDNIKKFFTSGGANRVLWAYVEKHRKTRREDVPKDIQNRYNAFIAYAYSILYWNQSSYGYTYTLTPEALERQKDYEDKWNQESLTQTGYKASYYEKMSTNLSRVTLVLHVMEQVYKNYLKALNQPGIDISKGVHCGFLPHIKDRVALERERIKDEEIRSINEDISRVFANGSKDEDEQPEPEEAKQEIESKPKPLLSDVTDTLRRLEQNGEYSFVIGKETVERAAKLMLYSYSSFCAVVDFIYGQQSTKMDDKAFIINLIEKHQERHKDGVKYGVIHNQKRFHSKAGEDADTRRTRVNGYLEELCNDGVLYAHKYKSANGAEAMKFYTLEYAKKIGIIKSEVNNEE